MATPKRGREMLTWLTVRVAASVSVVRFVLVVARVVHDFAAVFDIFGG